MDAEILGSLSELNINDTKPIDTNRCLLFEKLPAEIRIEIYEHVLRQEPAVIVVDLRDQHQNEVQSNIPLYALTMTCKQIHHETLQVRYRVNAVHIFAPVFVPDPSTNNVVDTRRRGTIVERLHSISTLQAETKQLTRVKIFLGRIPSLAYIRWMDFFMRWNSVVEVLRALKEGVPGLRVSFEAKLVNADAARFEFGVGSVEDVERGMDRGDLSDGNAAELTERESERLGKVKATIVRTLFPKGSDV